MLKTNNGRPDWHQSFRAVAVSSDGKLAIAVGKFGLIARSEDSGKNWEFVQSNVGVDLNAITLSRDGDLAIVVGDDGTILVSKNRGENWDGDDTKMQSISSRSLNAISLENDAITALIVGDDKSVLQIPLSVEDLLDNISQIDKLRIIRSLSEEEKEKIRTETERVIEERKTEFNMLKDRAFIYASVVRIGTILVLLLWVRHAADLMRYNLRLAAYYDARADAIVLVGWEKPPELSKLIDLGQLIREVSPDDLDIGRSPRSMLEWAMRLVSSILRGNSEK